MGRAHTLCTAPHGYGKQKNCNLRRSCGVWRMAGAARGIGMRAGRPRRTRPAGSHPHQSLRSIISTEAGGCGDPKE